MNDKIIFNEIKNCIDNESIKFLYDLLKEKEFSISHKNLPTFEDHKNFVLNHPYYKWFLIIFDNKKIGTIYFQNDNTVGITLLKMFLHLKKEIISYLDDKFDPLPAIKSFRTKNFSFNVSPNDDLTIAILSDANYRIDSIKYVK
tara:strand:- start:268 stop:699 length:432 start_codon:yes stop_codon:yes gene_type:complete